MAKFDAGTSVEALEYDFSTIDGGKGKGTVPEPSDKDMQKFQKAQGDIQKRMARLLRELEEEGKKLPEGEELSEERETFYENAARDISDEMDQAVAKLCKNRPSVEQMATLPFRHKVAFSAWLQREFSPEGVASGTKN